MGTPKSVAVIDQYPYPNAKFKLGTKLYQILEFTRELHDSFSTSGSIFSLVNELRTTLTTAGTIFVLLTELRTKMHTAGELFVLINELRTRLIANGDMFETLVDVADRAYNHMLVDPGWAEVGGTPVTFDNATQIDGVVDGVYAANLVAANTAVAPSDPDWSTGVGETREVTLSTPGGGTINATISAINATQPPRPPSGELPIGVVHIPASFTGGVTEIVAGGVTFTDGFPRRTDVPVAIAASALSAMTASAPGAISASALTTTTTTKPDQLPDTTRG